MACELKILRLDMIRIDGNTQLRERLSEHTVSLYEERMREGEVFPPCKAVFDGSDYWLYGGFHRYHAARKAGIEMIEAEVSTGTVEDARWLAIAENKEHDCQTAGLRRTNADKRRAVEAALRLRPQMSDRAIAEHCGVSDKTVAAVRGPVPTAEIPQSRTGRDGRTINTANIGRRPAETEERDNEPANADSPLIVDEELPRIGEEQPVGGWQAPSVAMTHAYEAINSMRKIPVDDPKRSRAYQLVRDFLKSSF